VTSHVFRIAHAVRQDYPELARLAAGHGVNVIEDAEEQAGAALDEIQQLRVKARNLRAINDSLLDQLSKAAGYRTAT
jgi:2-oxo-4-hydroxy-4-carboxy--5-ureidoimidazoline (OHCU) decarboxylase